MHQTAAFYEQNVNSISCHLLINDHYKNSLKGCRLFLEDPLYLWWEEGDDGCKIGGETKESEAGEDHTLAPELELFPHLIIFFLSLFVLWEIKPHRTRNRIASTPVRQNFWESTPCKEHLHFFVGFFFYYFRHKLVCTNIGLNYIHFTFSKFWRQGPIWQFENWIHGTFPENLERCILLLEVTMKIGLPRILDVEYLFNICSLLFLSQICQGPICKLNPWDFSRKSWGKRMQWISP